MWACAWPSPGVRNLHQKQAIFTSISINKITRKLFSRILEVPNLVKVYRYPLLEREYLLFKTQIRYRSAVKALLQLMHAVNQWIRLRSIIDTGHVNESMYFNRFIFTSLSVVSGVQYYEINCLLVNQTNTWGETICMYPANILQCSTLLSTIPAIIIYLSGFI